MKRVKRSSLSPAVFSHFRKTLKRVKTTINTDTNKLRTSTSTSHSHHFTLLTIIVVSAPLCFYFSFSSSSSFLLLPLSHSPPPPLLLSIAVNIFVQRLQHTEAMTTKAGSSQFTFSNYQITGYKHVLFLGVHWQSLVPLLLTHTHTLTHSPISLYIDHLLTTFFTVLIRQCTNTATTTTTITVHNSHCIQTIFSTL